jgi:hypothetical protein
MARDTSPVELLVRLLDQAYDRKSWHGPNLRGSIRGLDPAVAAWRPAPGRHCIWEIVVHAAYWKYHSQAAELPEGERDVFELVWYQGLTQAEAARVLGAQPRTVSYRYKKACLRLAEQVRGFEDLLRRGG